MNVEEKVDKLEKEVKELKVIVLTNAKAKKTVSLKGALKGLKVEEKDVKKAKKSLFRRR